MTICSGIRAEMFGEDYLRGTLAEVEAQSFEQHYLACGACFEHLRALQAARDVLGKEPKLVRRKKRASTGAVFAVAAAAIVIATLAVHWSRRSGRPARQDVALQAPVQSVTKPDSATAQESRSAQAPESSLGTELASLADRTLPPFHPTQIRGAAEDEHFEAGMRAYSANDCETALNELKRVPRTSAHADSAVLYAGACNYKLHRFSAASEHLAELAKNEDSPFSEAARYYLAQVALGQQNSAQAQHWLNEVLALRGDYELRALAQLRKLSSLESR
jgi:hypothetical protein